MVLPGLINLDFSDVRTVMTEMGKAMMGTGEASGEDRALMAAQNAIQNPLLDEVSLKGAKAVLVNVTGGLDMTLLEVDEAANAISDQVDPEANIIFGAAFDPALDGKIRVSVVATGMDGASIAAIEPKATPVAPPQAQPTIQSQPAAPVAQPVRQAEPVRATAQPEPVRAPIVEPVRAAQAQIARESGARFNDEPNVYAYDSEPDLPLEAPVARQPQQSAAPAPAPTISAPASPAATAAAADEEPLFPETRYTDDHSRKSFFSLFGRPRQEEPAPIRDYRNDPGPVLQARAKGGAQPAPQPETQPEQADDLEIPSFLRRLAN
jgi:cell division protein FtsZ